ncbi:MAG: hypothetical protein OEL77_05235 [Nitrosopumilus sp.]|nr:hypothetical protein [Nitrosopumilus sp.]
MDKTILVAVSIIVFFMEFGIGSIILQSTKYTNLRTWNDGINV